MQVDVLEYYDTSVRSASAQFLIPAVLRVRMYVSKREFKSGRLSLSRRNIVMRDMGMCQCVSTSFQHPAWALVADMSRIIDLLEGVPRAAHSACVKQHMLPAHIGMLFTHVHAGWESTESKCAAQCVGGAQCVGSSCCQS